MWLPGRVGVGRGGWRVMGKGPTSDCLEPVWLLGAAEEREELCNHDVINMLSLEHLEQWVYHFLYRGLNTSGQSSIGEYLYYAKVRL